MPKIFSSNPYFDDYNEDKQFQQILFKPGRAVQARELNQIQTLAQQQIERFGNHVFKEGSVVSDCPFALDLRLPFVKINDANASGIGVDLTGITAGMTLTGLTSGVTGYVISVLDGVQTATDTKTIFFKYTSANGTTKTFSNNENIEVRNSTGSLVNTVVSLSSNSTGNGSAFNLGDGVIYVEGYFLKHLSQTVILDRYSSTPSYKVGIELVESVVNSETDESLLDPALGSSNYFATGADRSKISTLLVKKLLSDEDTENFYLLYEIENGDVKRSLEKAQYNILQDELAKRTFEESGDYTVKPFTVRVREHINTGTNGGFYYANTNPLFVGNVSGNASLLVVGVEPGIGYVRGYRVNNLLTEYLTIEKGIAIESEEQQAVDFGYGHYIEVNEVSGPWDVDNGVRLSLRSANALSITNQTYGSTSAPGTEIGTARVKSIAYESGSIGLADGRYRIYLYDINLTANVPFANVRSVYFNATSGADSVGDLVLISNSAIIQETNFNTGLFSFPQDAIRRLRATNGSIDNTFEFKKTFSVTIAVDGTFSVSSPIASEEFPFGLGALNATQKRDNFVLVLDQAGTTSNLTGTITVTNGSKEITGAGTAFTTQIKAGDRIQTAGGNVYRIANVTSSTTANIITNAIGTESGVNYVKAFASGEYIDLSTTGSSGTTRSVSITSETSASVNIEETLSSTISAKILVNLSKINGQEIKKTLRKDRYVKIDCSTAGTTGPFNLGFSDIFRVSAIYHGTTYSENNTLVSNQFILDNGQRDTHYTHGRLSLKSDANLSLTSASRLLVKLDYFFHDTSIGVGFFSVDSYPIDDTGVTPNTIRTEEIPLYVSQTNGQIIDLRNTLDIRPRYTDTSSDATTIVGASTNPASPTALSVPSGGLRTGVANEEFITDLDYYLSRKDLVYIDKAGKFGVVKGLYSIAPPASSVPADSLALAHITIPPFPSLSSQAARASGRTDYEVGVLSIDNKRYTMASIGAINQKINRLEYYSALTFLENEAKNKVIASDVTGLDRFKNGFLVDNFKGHSVGSVNDINYKCSVDPQLGELRPRFSIDNIDFEFNSAASTNVVRAPRDAVLTVTSITGTFAAGDTITQSSTTGIVLYVIGSKIFLNNVNGTFTTGSFVGPSGSGSITSVAVTPNGDLVSLPYTHTVFAQNPFATKPRNCVGELLFIWNGEMALRPPADNWTDTLTNPDVVVNFDNNLDNWLTLDQAWGTQWSDWETNWTGTSVDRTFLGTQAVGQRTEAITRTIPAINFGFGIEIPERTVQVGNRVITDNRSATAVNTTITERQSRSGTNLSVVPQTVNYDLGNRTVDVSVIPFIRSQVVSFSARRLKPNTRVYPFFDGENVSIHCRPFGGNYGDPLVTNSTGVIVGDFLIPNNTALRFRVGQRIFKLADDDQDRPGFTTTSATEIFNAFGIQQTQETTILSSRQASIGFSTENENRTTRTESTTIETSDRETSQDFYFDPIAQTFIIQNTNGNGLFLSKLELYFRTKSATLPVTLQIREVVNGFPGSRIIPFGSVTLESSEVNVSEDASAPTIFTFPSPVYLIEGVEYCFVILPAGNNPDYNIWVSELGQNQLGTTNRVSEQPYVGILFTSANNRAWTPVQAEDIKFTLYRANFQTGTTGTIILDNDNSDYANISNFSLGVFKAGDEVRWSSGTGVIVENDLRNQVVRILKDGTATIRSRIDGTGNITANTSSNVIVGNGTLFASEAYANAVIFSANTGTRIGKVVSIANDATLTLDSVAENVTSNVFIIYDEITYLSNSSIRATVENLNNKRLNLFHTNLSLLSFVPTTYETQYKIRNSSTGVVGSYDDFILNEDYYLTSEAIIASNSNETTNFSGTKSYSTKIDVNSSSSFVSPVLDLFKTSSIIVHNQINNDSTNETLNAGNALARYISKMVTLDEGQDAEDLKVYLTAYKPPNTDILVFAKLLSATDSTPFNDINYVQLERVTSSIVTSNPLVTSDYKEYEYKLPASVLTGPNGEFQYTSGGNVFTSYKHFSIKIVLLSTNTSVVPKVKDYRAIALQL